MTTIKGSVHDHIEIEGAARALPDTPEMQRLRHIKQLGTVQLVYPSANYTWFERSLGVYHLISRALSHLGIESGAAAYVKTAAFLRDIGHGPYSHNIGDVAHRHTGKYHDDVGGFAARRTVGRALEDERLDPEHVATLVEGDGEFGRLASGELDVDRVDYLVHDAHRTGVPYSTIDHERLVQELMLIDGELVLAEGNIQIAESLFLACALMNLTVYQHHVTRISKAMLRHASERLLDGDTDAGELRRMDDSDLLVALRLADSTSAFAERLATHDLYKRTVWAELPNTPDSIIDAKHDVLATFEQDITATADVSSESVILDVPSRPSITKPSSRVTVDNEMRQSERESPLVRVF